MNICVNQMCVWKKPRTCLEYRFQDTICTLFIQLQLDKTPFISCFTPKETIRTPLSLQSHRIMLCALSLHFQLDHQSLPEILSHKCGAHWAKLKSNIVFFQLFRSLQMDQRRLEWASHVNDIESTWWSHLLPESWTQHEVCGQGRYVFIHNDLRCVHTHATTLKWHLFLEADCT